MLSLPCSQSNDYIRELCLELGEFSSDFLLEISGEISYHRKAHKSKD